MLLKITTFVSPSVDIQGICATQAYAVGHQGPFLVGSTQKVDVYELAQAVVVLQVDWYPDYFSHVSQSVDWIHDCSSSEPEQQAMKVPKQSNSAAEKLMVTLSLMLRTKIVIHVNV